MKNKKGFTIVELVIVIAVIAILAAVLIPTFSGVVNRANQSSGVQTARTALTNVLSGNVQNGVLNAAEFLVNNGSKVYQFSYVNGQLITEDKTVGENSYKAGEENVGTNLELINVGDYEVTAYKAGDTKSCGYKTVILKSAASISEPKVKAAIKAALKITEDTNTSMTITKSENDKVLTVKLGDTQLVSFDLFFNSDFSDGTVVFIK